MYHGTNHTAPTRILNHCSLIDYPTRQHLIASLGNVHTSRGRWDSFDSGNSPSGQQPAKRPGLMIYWSATWGKYKKGDTKHLAAWAEKYSVQYSLTSHAHITRKTIFLGKFCQIENAKISICWDFTVRKWWIDRLGETNQEYGGWFRCGHLSAYSKMSRAN